MRRTPATFAQALAQLSERPTPALIWRNGDERVELSGRVLVNWVEKSASLLVDELDVESGQLITVSPRQHWRLVVLTLAALRVGASVRFGENSADDAAVHAALEGHLNDGVPPEHVLAVASPALAFACEEDVSDPVIDFCAEVRSFPDAYMGMEAPQDGDDALPEAGITHGELLGEAERAASAVEDHTVYVPLKNGWKERALLITLGLLLRDGAVLLTANESDVTPDVLAQEKAVPLSGE
ncbi:TIGR03089 family protein [Kocuria carniphila]|uniref:TIGR03089 family protein n=1 Tax=Kocuria carniphila TaxID=262208 RepID=UPI0034CDAC60